MTKPSSKPPGAKPPATTAPAAPFADGTASFELAGFTVENGTESVAVYGQTDLTRDKAGLEKARALIAFLQAAVTTMEADPALPDQVAPPKPKGTVKNPFN